VVANSAGISNPTAIVIVRIRTLVIGGGGTGASRALPPAKVVLWSAAHD